MHTSKAVERAFHSDVSPPLPHSTRFPADVLHFVPFLSCTADVQMMPIRSHRRCPAHPKLTNPFVHIG